MGYYPETAEQVAVVKYCDIKGYPYNMIYSNENEAGGKRSPASAARAKAMGKRAGVSDLFLPVMRNGYGGLYIEMKAKDGKVKPEQRNFIENMQKEGYVATICYSAQDAIDFIELYLNSK